MTLRTETLTVEQSRPGERLDTFLRHKFPAASRSAIQRLIEEGCITVNDKPTKPTHSPRAGEVVKVTWPDARPAEAQPEDIPLEVLFEDDALLVLNKPAGLVVHPAAGHEEPAQVGVRRDFQQPAIYEAKALLKPVKARQGLSLGRLAERVIAAFPVPAEDDAVTAVVPFFQRGHASIHQQIRIRGLRRRECNGTPMCSPVFPLKRERGATAFAGTPLRFAACVKLGI